MTRLVEKHAYRPTLSVKRASVSIRRMFYLAVSFAYGFIFSQIPDQQFLDFTNYLVFAESAWIIVVRNIVDGPLTVLTNEPIWLSINLLLNQLLLPETVVRTIIFFSATSVAWLLLCNHPRFFVWLIIFLFLPTVFKHFLIHLRQGFAISIFLWGWFANDRLRRWLLIGITPFIHSSFFFILLLIIFGRIVKSMRFALDLKLLVYVLLGIFISFSLSVFAEILGARQADYYEFRRADVSGMAFVLWTLVLFIFATSGKTWLRNHTFEFGIVCFYLGTYWFVEVTGRIFESGFIIVLIAGLTLPTLRRMAVLGIIVTAEAFGLIMRIGQPLMGYGIS